MSTVIKCCFPGGRYHATPWGSHVNEGLVEWPPSPWRLLRALLSVWFWKARDEHSEEQIEALFGALAQGLPEYHLPSEPGRSHTRHYMPLYKDKPKKIFDAFIHLEPGDAIWICWPQISLASEQRQLLSCLLEGLGYLGRAESWVEASLADEAALEAALASQKLAHVQPKNGHSSPVAGEICRVLCPMNESDLLEWRGQMVSSLEAQTLAQKRQKLLQKGKSPEKATLSKKEKETMEGRVPSRVVDVLQANTNDLQKQGWSQPPGSQWVEYVTPDEPPLRPGRQARPEPVPHPQVARFVLSSPVLPLLSDALPFCSVVHRALVSHSDARLPVFTGKDHNGNPYCDHPHAYLLPESSGGSPRIHGLTLYAKMGFSPEAQEVLSHFIELWEKGGSRPRWGSRQHGLRMVLVGLGELASFAGSEEFLGGSTLLMSSKVWHSVTPFVPTRHAKYKGRRPKLDQEGLHIGSPTHDLRRLLRLNHHIEPVSVESMPHAVMGGREVSWLSFVTERSRGRGQRAGHRGYGFRIEFAEEVQGPLALGYGAHFGLGVFAPGEPPSL